MFGRLIRWWLRRAFPYEPADLDALTEYVAVLGAEDEAVAITPVVGIPLP